MQKSRKLPRDLNARAARIVAISTGQLSDRDGTPSAAKVKGGNARADALSPEKRRDIARVAAAARWKKKSD
jgi:hypothetical protein